MNNKTILLFLIFSFFIFIILCFYYIKTKYRKNNIKLLYSVTNLDRGNIAEHNLITKLLKAGISPKAIFHDLYIQKSNGKFCQIDLLAATKVGIIVFEVKDYSGWIYGNGKQNKWTQVLSYGREKYRFYNPIIQNNNHIFELRKYLKENVNFYSVIVFDGDSFLIDISFIPDGTYIIKPKRIIDVINEITEENKPANYKDKRKIINLLKKAVLNGNDENIVNSHIKNIKDMIGKHRIFE